MHLSPTVSSHWGVKCIVSNLNYNIEVVSKCNLNVRKSNGNEQGNMNYRKVLKSLCREDRS